MFLSSIANRCPGLGHVSVSSSCCSLLQCVAGFGSYFSGVSLQSSDCMLGGGLMGSGIILGVQSVVQWIKISGDSQFSLNCKRMSCLTLATLINGAAWAYAFSLPEEDSNRAAGFGFGGWVISEGIANVEDLVHFVKKRCCSENLRYEEIPQN